MSNKVIGATVGTTTSPAKIAKEIKPIKTVNGVAPDENGNVVINVPSGGGNGVADYAQNDPNGEGYIKNRPFYKETKGVDVVVFSETSVPFASGSELVNGFVEGSFVEGNKYIVKWDGTEYEAYCYVEDGTYCIGNGVLASMTTETDHPFCIVSFGGKACYVYKSTETAESITIGVNGVQETIYHKIGKEYLPDDIGGGSEKLDSEIFNGGDYIIPETSLTMTEFGSGSKTVIHSDGKIKIGETYTVIWNGVKYSCVAKAAGDNAILGNGIYFSLPATDDPFCLRFLNDAELTENVEIFSLDYIATATIEVTTPQTINPKYIPDMYYTEGGMVEILPETEITLTVDDDEGAADPLSTAIFDYIEFQKGVTYIVKINGTEYESVAWEFSAEGNSIVLLGNGALLGVEGGNGEPFLLYGMVGQGSIFVYDGAMETGTLAVSGNIETIHKIDNKYLDLEWLPVINKTKTTLYEGTIELYSLGAPLLEVVDGEEYTVAFNGTEYKCVGHSVTLENEGSSASVQVLGNASMGTYTASFGLSADTGEPFCYECVYQGGEPTMVFLHRTDDTAAVDLKITGTLATPNKLPAEFLPDDRTVANLDGTSFTIGTQVSVSGDTIYNIYAGMKARNLCLNPATITDSDGSTLFNGNIVVDFVNYYEMTDSTTNLLFNWASTIVADGSNAVLLSVAVCRDEGYCYLYAKKLS